MSGVIHKKDSAWIKLGEQRTACDMPFVKQTRVNNPKNAPKKTVDGNERVVERWADVTCPKCLSKKGGETTTTKKVTQDGKEVYQKLRKTKSIGRSQIKHIQKYNENSKAVAFKRAKKEHDNE